RHLPQTVDVIRRWPLQAPPHDHAQAIPQPPVAGRAENIESLLAALDELARHGKRDPVDELFAVLAGEENFIRPQQPARHGAFGNWTSRAAVGEKAARTQRNIFRLILHVLAAADGHAG